MKQGIKNDDHKARWDLLPWDELNGVVDVLTFGADKYAPKNWQSVPDGKSRYFSAAMRHITAWWNGEQNDKESGRHHLAHAICCLMFIMWFEKKGKR